MELQDSEGSLGDYAFLIVIPQCAITFHYCPSHPHFPPTPGQLIFILEDSE